MTGGGGDGGGAVGGIGANAGFHWVRQAPPTVPKRRKMPAGVDVLG